MESSLYSCLSAVAGREASCLRVRVDRKGGRPVYTGRAAGGEKTVVGVDPGSAVMAGIDGGGLSGVRQGSVVWLG